MASPKDHNSSGVVATSEGEVSFQVFQDVYNSLTGRTEKITQYFHDYHRAEMSDFEQLHHRFEQAVEQYDCHESRLTVTVRYVNGKTEKFSGFSRFKSQGLKRGYATESVELEYDFLLLLPKTSEAKPYKLLVGLRSSLGTMQSLRDNAQSDFELEMMFRLKAAHARLEIQYVDLAVARTFEAQIEEWYRGLNKISTWMGEWSRKSAAFVDLLIRSTALAAAAILLVYLFKDQVNTGSEVFRSVIVGVAALSIVRIFTFPIAQKAELWLKMSGAQSAIILGKSDEDLLKAHQSTPWRVWGKVAMSGLFAIGCSLAASYFAHWLGL